MCSIEYWFRCMDVDGDGVLSMFELEFFYEEQCERMERMGIEPLPFQDLLCQMLDLVKPESAGTSSVIFHYLLYSFFFFFYPAVTASSMRVFVCMSSPGKITLGDLKRCRMAHIFFDTFFNLEKYLDHEQRDPFAVQKVCDIRRRKSLKHESVPSKEKKIIIEFENCSTVYEKWAEMLVMMGHGWCHSTTLWLWMLLNKYRAGDEIWKMIWFWWWWNDDYLPNIKIPSLALEQ